MSGDRQQQDERWDAAYVRRLRRHAGLSQEQLAQELNTRQQTISEWERGAYRPRGMAARLLTRVAEDVQFPFESGSQADFQADVQDVQIDADDVARSEGAEEAEDG